MRRFAITKEGECYRLKEITATRDTNSYYQDLRFVRKSDGQLADEKGILGTLTLGGISFENGTSMPTSVVLASFCYEQFLLMKQRAPLQPPTQLSRQLPAR